MKLTKYEKIIAAFGERCKGPGWSNTPILVLVRRTGGDLRLEYIQPEDQTGVLSSLFGVSCEINKVMVAAVEATCVQEREWETKECSTSPNQPASGD